MPIVCSKYKISWSVFLAVMVFVFFMNCEKKNARIDSKALAVVGKKIIDQDYFIIRYKDFRRQTGAADNGLARRSVLNNIIGEELLITEAHNRNYDNDAAGRHEYERIKKQELLNAYQQRFIISHVTITDAELKRLFINLHIKPKARHLYAPTLTKADSLYHLLQHGVSFEEIAKTCFHDPVLRESGGSLGYFTVDEMDPAFEEAAYALKIGEISKPVRTNDGYSVIRVDDRTGNPFVMETEFTKHRSDLEAYWEKIKIYKATQQHTDSLSKELNITFNEPIVQELYKILQRQNGSKFALEFDLSKSISPQLKNEDLAYSKLGVWDVKKFQEAAQFTSPKERGWIRNEENLKDYIAGLVVRSFIFSEAKKYKLDKTSDYKNRIAEDFDTTLLERIEDDLFKEFEIPLDTLHYYYEDDPTLFAEPLKVQLHEIALADSGKIKFIASRLENGDSSAELAKECSENRRRDGKNYYRLLFIDHT